MRKRLATLIAITALAATGCGSDYGSDDDNNSGNSATDKQTETTPPPTKTTEDKPRGAY